MSELLNLKHIESMRKYNDNFQWLVKNYEVIKDQHRAKHIAINGGALVDEDEDIDILYNRLKKNFPNEIKSILLKYIPEKDYLMV